MMKRKWFAPIVIALVLVFGLVISPQLPDIVPSHWNFAGEVDGHQSKALAMLLIPVLMALIWTVSQFGYRFHFFGHTLETLPTSPAILNLLVVFLGIVQVFTLGSAVGWQIAVPRVVMVLVGLLLAALGNQMRRLKPNLFIGIRTPWTLRDPETWRKTHAYAGRLYFGVGLLVTVLALLLPITTILAFSLVLILAVSLWVVYYSYRVWRVISHELSS